MMSQQMGLQTHINSATAQMIDNEKLFTSSQVETTENSSSSESSRA
jgi:hypothetical protein